MKHDDPLPSRSSASPLGKLTGWLPKQRIEETILEKFAERAAEAFRRSGFVRKPGADVVRDIVRVIALGPKEASRIYGESVLVVFKTWDGMSDKK